MGLHFALSFAQQKKSAFFYPLPLVGHYLCIKDGDYLIGSNDIIWKNYVWTIRLGILFSKIQLRILIGKFHREIGFVHLVIVLSQDI